MRRFHSRSITTLSLLLALAGAGAAQTRLVAETLVDDARGKGAEWRFTTEVPAEGWTTAGFDASAWLTGWGGFGTSNTAGSHATTDWTTAEIHLRHVFTLEEARYENLMLSVHHDDEVEVYLNGVPIHTEAGALGAYASAWLGDDALRTLKAGENVLAVRCVNSGGGPQYVDVGLSGMRSVRIATLSPDARDAATEWRYTLDQPGAGWEGVDFDDTSWPAGQGGFGGDQPQIATPWSSSDIWLRRSFVSERAFPGIILTYRNDDDMEIYLNGQRVLMKSCCTNDYGETFLKEPGAVVKQGTNVLAVHCANTGGGPQFVDVGLIGWEADIPVAARRPVAPARKRPGVFRYGWIASGRRIDGRSFGPGIHLR